MTDAEVEQLHHVLGLVALEWPALFPSAGMNLTRLESN
jgi:hypothetical protein